ncbi:protein kinase domain-containing protein [Ditylenchus destructor]|nr:protein kinase domain-containing protein [Ditylenchus destructor]
MVRHSSEGQSHLFDKGFLLRKRWHIQEMLGKGGYGQIYLAYDQLLDTKVAVKAEPTHRNGRRARRMILEQRVLVKLQGTAHTPILLQSGLERDVNFFVLQLLSPNVGDFRKQSPIKRLSKSTTGRIVQQAISGLRDIHNIGYINRDVKPANMCFGVTPATRHRLFLIDYGLVRRFKTHGNQQRPRRAHAGFRGTLRYVSLRVHAREEPGPADDLVSLFYSMIELIRGSVPWRSLHHNNDVWAVKEKLQADSFEKISENISESIKEFGKAVTSMGPEEEPDYTALQELLKDMVGDQNISSPYDWENSYVDALSDFTLTTAVP